MAIYCGLDKVSLCKASNLMRRDHNHAVFFRGILDFINGCQLSAGYGWRYLHKIKGDEHLRIAGERVAMAVRIAGDRACLAAL
jgi:hypothetical protein